jgi:hypothetical protein
MADHAELAEKTPNPSTSTAPRDAVAESVGRTRWSVTGSAHVLPAELAHLVAPSIVVHAAPVPKARPSMPGKLDLRPDVRLVAPASPRR